MRKTVSFALAAIAAATFSVSANASTLISDNFTRVSPVENIVALFAANGGATTTGTYTGFVEILVSGTGFSLGSAINDAFYLTQGQQGLANNFYHLGLGTTAEPWSANSANLPNLGVERFMNFIDGVGVSGPGSIPGFSSNSSYNFVVDLSSQSSQLTFGVLDGVYSDNGGAYQLSVWQLRPGAAAVPEPATWLMMIVGFGAVGAAVRRKPAAAPAPRLA